MGIEDLTSFTPREAGVLLHISESMVRKLIAAGLLKAYVHMGQKNRKRLMILESDLRTYLYTMFLEPYWHGAKRPPNLSKGILEVGSFKGSKGKQ